ncbi:hypothetical protein LOK49_LG14G01903 [Camellia lanceoleosa]|uniref:Uncharacterized protein n=1 Tax=Camellia lanceoleosa TaxID=1840588 RepID=A0ACC0FDR9_9ERIC|nr:hypothetical protein LOK49_LG14G01903 [Camellia lanceoleosa]
MKTNLDIKIIFNILKLLVKKNWRSTLLARSPPKKRKEKGVGDLALSRLHSDPHKLHFSIISLPSLPLWVFNEFDLGI